MATTVAGDAHYRPSRMGCQNILRRVGATGTDVRDCRMGDLPVARRRKCSCSPFRVSIDGLTGASA